MEKKSLMNRRVLVTYLFKYLPKWLLEVLDKSTAILYTTLTTKIILLTMVVKLKFLWKQVNPFTNRNTRRKQ